MPAAASFPYGFFECRVLAGQTGWLMNHLVCPTELLWMFSLTLQGQWQRDAALDAALDKVHLATPYANAASERAI